ncbi:LCCL domain-containing protein [Histidinibacterium lentulum]|nr:LCCL domain-containing protein [Histidinibacterium lentulum]
MDAQFWGRAAGIPALAALALTGAAALAQESCPGRYPANTESHTCVCGTGDVSGTVWGSGPYTADSALCAAAAHAGAFDPDTGGEITARLAPGEASYSGSEQNGVTTRNWGAYSSSIIFDVAVTIPAGLEMCGAYPVSVPEYACGCAAGEAFGAVWGSGPYTADSDVCAAARHAGVIGTGGGPVMAMAFPGLLQYLGSTRNGVESMDWGTDALSFVFDANR